MTRSLIIILLIGGVSIYYSNIDSDAAMVAIFLPLVAVLSLMALALWFVVLFHRHGISHNASPGGDGGGDSYCGGDGGE